MRTREIWRHFWDIAGSVGIRTKIMGIVAFLVLGFGAFVGWYIPHSESIYLTNQLEMRGLTIARGVAALGRDMVLTNNQFSLYMLSKNTLNNNDDIVYVFVTDARGEIIVHTFEGGFPSDMLGISQDVRVDNYRIIPLLTEKGKIRDVAVPIMGGRAGVVHVGLDESAILAYSVHHARSILLITAIVLLVGIIFAYGLATVLTRPISDLELATKMISSQNILWEAPIWARDEIGRLGISFNEMMKKISKTTEEIIQRNKELATLNAISQAMAQSLKLNETLPVAMKKILEGTGLKAGWFFLFNRQSQELELFCQEGIINNNFTPEMVQELATQVKKRLGLESDGETQEKLNPLTSPMVSSWLSKEGDDFLEVVPLMVSQHCLGVLVLAKGSGENFTGDERRLLNVIADQISVAVENSLLWEELKYKEEMRSQLLAKVITAQEEERKRIARELHDQTGQSITSFLVGLRVAEEARDDMEMKKRFNELRALAQKTLEEVRNLSLELRPSVLDDLGLIPALNRYIKDYALKTGLSIQFQTSGFNNRRLLPEMETIIYRVVQEALTNVVRHARAKNVSVIMEHTKSNLLVIIEDDGLGFDVTKIRQSLRRDEALGLYGMEERMSLISGKITIESAPGRGTTIYAEIPLREAYKSVV